MTYPDNVSLVLGSILLLGVAACRRSGDNAAAPLRSSSAHSSDTNNNFVPPHEQREAGRRALQKMKKQTMSKKADTADAAYSPAASASAGEPVKDTNAAGRFFLLQSFANSLRTPSKITERPPMHPDSMAWEDIAGIPQPQKETPGWMKALGYLKTAAVFLTFVYLLFFDK